VQITLLLYVAAYLFSFIAGSAVILNQVCDDQGAARFVQKDALVEKRYAAQHLLFQIGGLGRVTRLVEQKISA